MRCQSVAEPPMALYWPIGATTILFANSNPRRRKAEKRWLPVTGRQDAFLTSGTYGFEVKCSALSPAASLRPVALIALSSTLSSGT